MNAKKAKTLRKALRSMGINPGESGLTEVTTTYRLRGIDRVAGTGRFVQNPRSGRRAYKEMKRLAAR